ncbi:hypothetical protein Nepgr_014674 [Nepenthes gracilis]|uniref:Uncharacterized protein n=1 Tax=Nepenthes gracilis TaxID=150966 RepID=A0AAD3SKG1_NEPGR|nr:hypothetical protein Nepgr_014674 [Nepenthes gracilis]
MVMTRCSIDVNKVGALGFWLWREFLPVLLLLQNCLVVGGPLLNHCLLRSGMHCCPVGTDGLMAHVAGASWLLMWLGYFADLALEKLC